MSEIALYNVLTKLGAVPQEAEKAVADVASSKEVATKSDIKDMATKSDIKGMATKTDIAELETRMTWKMIVLGVAIVGLIKYL